MKLAALPLCIAIAIAPMPSAGDAQDGPSARWSRAMPADQSFSVEVPCSTEQVTHIPPGQVRRREGDEQVSVTCEAGGAIFFASRVVVPVDRPLPRPLFDLMRDSISAAGVGSSMSIADFSASGRRAFSGRQTSDALVVGQTSLIELTDHSCLLLITGAGGSSPSRDMEQHIDRFIASVEVSP
jgi:hypothetical protein